MCILPWAIIAVNLFVMRQATSHSPRCTLLPLEHWATRLCGLAQGVHDRQTGFSVCFPACAAGKNLYLESTLEGLLPAEQWATRLPPGPARKAYPPDTRPGSDADSNGEDSSPGAAPSGPGRGTPPPAVAAQHQQGHAPPVLPRLSQAAQQAFVNSTTFLVDIGTPIVCQKARAMLRACGMCA